MNRNDAEAFAASWLKVICDELPFDSMLGDALDPKMFAERASLARTKLGTPLQGTVDEIVCEGARIAWRWTLRGPNGTIRGVNFQEIGNGRAVTHWTLAV